MVRKGRRKQEPLDHQGKLQHGPPFSFWLPRSTVSCRSCFPLPATRSPSLPADTAARAGRGTAPAVAAEAAGAGDMRGTSATAPPPHAASAGETATPQLQNVLTSAAGPPSRRTEPSAVKALLPLWAGLDASMYSFRFNEGAFLRGEIFTFSFPGGHLRPDDTQTGSPPLPFPIPTSLEASGGGETEEGGLLGEQNREGNKMLINQPASPFPLPSVESMESVISHANPPPISLQHLFRKVFGKSP